MKRLLSPIMFAAASAFLMCFPMQAQAQGGGGGGRNFNPEEMRQRMMDRYKESLGVTNDDEWKVIEPRIQKVMQARQETMSFGGMGRGFGRGGRAGGGGGDTAQADSNRQRRGGGGGGFGAFGGQRSQAATDLQKALDDKASAEQVKAKLAAYREDRQTKQANLEKAREDLKKVLNVRQEAAAVLEGLLE